MTTNDWVDAVTALLWVLGFAGAVTFAVVWLWFPFSVMKRLDAANRRLEQLHNDLAEIQTTIAVEAARCRPAVATRGNEAIPVQNPSEISESPSYSQ